MPTIAVLSSALQVSPLPTDTESLAVESFQKLMKDDSQHIEVQEQVKSEDSRLFFGTNVTGSFRDLTSIAATATDLDSMQAATTRHESDE